MHEIMHIQKENNVGVSIIERDETAGKISGGTCRFKL